MISESRMMLSWIILSVFLVSLRSDFTYVSGKDVVYCNNPGRVANGRISFHPPEIDRRSHSEIEKDPELPEGTRLEYKCEDEYTLQGTSILQCKSSGMWSANPPYCSSESGKDVVYCKNPRGIANGRISYHPPEIDRRSHSEMEKDPEFPEGTRLEYTCEDEYTLQGTSILQCESSGMWSANPPYCSSVSGKDVVYCDNPGRVANGRISYHPPEIDRRSHSEIEKDPEFPEGTRLEYTCEDEYTLQGSSNLQCESSGMWSANPPYCTSENDIIYCDNPGPVANGNISYFPPEIDNRSGSEFETDPEFPQSTRLEYTCEDDYSLLGTSTLQCESSGMWSADPPLCSAECGRGSTALPQFLPNKVMSPRDWPWVVALAVQDRNNKTRFLCGGALLNRRTIVTAAHCLVHAKYFLLYFGKLRLTDKENDSNIVVRRSTRLILHPSFNRKYTNFDSDIGLVTFDPPISFSDFIQPICLPSVATTSKNLLSGKTGYVTGFGLTEKSIRSTKLQKAHVLVMTDDDCIKVYKTVGWDVDLTHNMFCGSYVDGQRSFCRIYSGSPLVFYDRQSEQYTLEGIVSIGMSGSYCQPGRNTVVYVKVFNFLPWILQNM